VTRRWRRPRTAVRLALFHLVVLATVLGAAVAVMVRTFSARVDESATSALAAQLRSFQRSLGTSSHGRGLDEVASSYLATRALPSGTSLAIVVGRRAFVSPADARTLLASAPLGRLLARPLPRTVARRVDADHRDEEVLVAPIRSGGREVGVFVAALDLGPYDRESAHLALLASLEAAVALLAGVASAALLLRRLLRTIGGITTAAEEIATGQLDRRIGPQGADDEVGRLAATFDAMLDRLERAIDAQRRLLSDVSHQLRTPLTIARGHLEVLARTGFEDREEVSETVALVLDELDHLRHLVERLLLLGRSLEPDFLACEPVDVRGLVGDVREAASVLAPHGVRLGAVVDAVVDADVTKLRGAVASE
jgi:two-component system OmpR family sensor kinase